MKKHVRSVLHSPNHHTQLHCALWAPKSSFPLLLWLSVNKFFLDFKLNQPQLLEFTKSLPKPPGHHRKQTHDLPRALPCLYPVPGWWVSTGGSQPLKVSAQFCFLVLFLARQALRSGYPLSSVSFHRQMRSDLFIITKCSVCFHYEHSLTAIVNTRHNKHARNHCSFQATFSKLSNTVPPLNIFVFWYTDEIPPHLLSLVAYILLCALQHICNCANHLGLFSFRPEWDVLH